MMGAITNMDLTSSNAALHDSSKSNFPYFSNSFHNGLEIFEKYFYESFVKSSISQETSYPLACFR